MESKNPHSLQKLLKDGWQYPTTQINTTNISEPINYLDLVISVLHEEQDKAYNFVIEKTKETTFKDYGFIFFSHIEQKPMILSTDHVPLIKLSHASPICGSDATIIRT